MAASSPLPAEQVALRSNAAEIEARFHTAGWVADNHGAAMQRLTGMLMFGRRDADRQTPQQFYYQTAGLTAANAETVLATARRDIAEATTLIYNLGRDSEAVAAAAGITSASLGDDVGELERTLSDARQVIDLFRSVDAEHGADALIEEIGALELATEGLRDATDALAQRRRELRNAPAS
ncbi:MAG: hypothetical protein DHS20C06_17560 [Hyphobacterium sp.]|nr:MAG: hypothetical protein DHS20C06_17560 [Hyphobacterium sp.]